MHTHILEKEIEMSKNKKIIFDMGNISKLVCSDTIIKKKYSEEICLKLRDILSNKGIDVTIDEYGNGEKFLTLKKGKTVIDKPKPTKINECSEDENSLRAILKDNKLYDKEIKSLLCPECHHYCVDYYTSMFKEYDKRWWCHNCLDVIIYRDYNIDLSDKDKYQIYKLWGAEALSILTNESMKKTIGFVGSYFKYGCMSKKDKCLYFDFFKEKENKMGEGDIVDERSEMGIVRRNERGKQSDIVESSKLEGR